MASLKCCFYIFTYVFLCITHFINGTDETNRVMEKFRLPRIANPTHYTIKILTKLSDDFRFDGEVWIDFSVRNETKSITLNSKNLQLFENETKIEEITDSKHVVKREFHPSSRIRSNGHWRKHLKSSKADGENINTSNSTPIDSTTTTTLVTSVKPNDTMDINHPQTTTEELNPSNETNSEVIADSMRVTSHDHDTERQFLTMEINEKILPDRKYRLYLKFRGFLSDSFYGFYRVPYLEKNKKTSWLAATTFEPVDARGAFPCFDEPEYKASFDVILGHSSEYISLSNMPMKTSVSMEDQPGWQWDTFETTPKMSTFLVSFVIHDLEILPLKNSGNSTKYRYWARKDIVYKADYASEIAPRMKSYLEQQILDLDPMPKIDFIALPGFMSSALENWGIIAFSEKGLLFSPGYSSIFSKYETTRLIGHELAHMWFGNSLTPKWWDQIWLSEGISNFLETEAADHVQPQWDVKTYSAVSSYLKIFSIDALHNTHALVPKVNTLQDLNEIFDSITYQKGYYLMRMLNYTLGGSTFKDGLRLYVKQNRLSNVDEEDLWTALTDQGHKDGSLSKEYDLNVLMRAWTRDAGYPIVDVTRNYLNRTITMKQRRFVRPQQDYEYRAVNNETKTNQQWFIPITYTSGEELQFDNTKPRLWLTPDKDETIIEDLAPQDVFLLMNIQASGLYRVNYDIDNWALIIDYLLGENYTNVAVINRVQIIDDLLDFARSNVISYQQALDATKYLRQEKHYLPWKAALTNFEYISRMLRSTDASRVFKKFMRNLVSARYEELGLEGSDNESLFESMNRKQIVKWACRTGHKDCTRKSLDLFKKWTEEKKPDENNPIPSNLRSVIYCTAIEQGGARDWQFLWQRYLSNTVVTDKGAIITGLGCSKNTRTLRKYLDWSIKETSGIKKQDSASVFKAVASNDIGFAIAKTFLKEHLDEYPKYIGDSGTRFSNMVDSLAKKMNQRKDLTELDEITRGHAPSSRLHQRTFQQATEKVQFNIGWVDNNFQTIKDWLKFQTI